MAADTVNFDEWSTYLLAQLRRSVALTSDPDLRALEREVRRYPNVAATPDRPAGYSDEPRLLVPLQLRADAGQLSLFTTLTTFGTPRDVTLDELAIELFYPADEATATALSGDTSTHVSHA